MAWWAFALGMKAGKHLPGSSWLEKKNKELDKKMKQLSK